MTDSMIDLFADDLRRAHSTRAADRESAIEGLIAFAIAFGTFALVLFHGGI